MLRRIFHTHGARINPRQIGCLARRDLQSRTATLNEIHERISIPTKVIHELDPPWLTVTIGRLGCVI